MKKLKNLNGAKALSKKEQQFIKGGTIICDMHTYCPSGYVCKRVTPYYAYCVEDN